MLLAGILIIIDLGQPFRMFELIINANLASPLMWDVLAVGLFIVVSILYLVFLQRIEEGRASTVSMRVMSGIACAAALIVITVDAWIFGLQQGREMWNTALLGPWFVTSALLSGVGFAILTAAVGKKFGREILPEKGRATLFKLLGALACLVHLRSCYVWLWRWCCCKHASHWSTGPLVLASDDLSCSVHRILLRAEIAGKIFRDSCSHPCACCSLLEACRARDRRFSAS